MTQGPTDVCKLPDNKPVGFDNWIETKDNLQNGSTKTFHQGSLVGPT